MHANNKLEGLFMLEDILNTFFKSIISFAVLFMLTRILGKKQLSQLSFFDYVVGISIGSIAASFAVDSSISFSSGITGLIVYAIFPVLLSFIALKSYRARKLLDGIPTVLIYNGKLIKKNIKKSKMTVNDVLEECRLKNAFDIADVEFAVLETDGLISVQKKSQHQPLTPFDVNIKTPYKGLCINVIIDGHILDDKLQVAGKDRNWLADELLKQNVVSAADVLLGYINNSGDLIIQKQNDSNPENPLI